MYTGRSYPDADKMAARGAWHRLETFVDADEKQVKGSSDIVAPGKSEKSGDPPAAAARPRHQPLAPEIQAQIGRRLLAVYDEMLQQPVPERFRALLDKLDQPSIALQAKGKDNGDPA